LRLWQERGGKFDHEISLLFLCLSLYSPYFDRRFHIFSTCLSSLSVPLPT
jgi:hypothetical protein